MSSPPSPLPTDLASLAAAEQALTSPPDDWSDYHGAAAGICDDAISAARVVDFSADADYDGAASIAEINASGQGVPAGFTVAAQLVFVPNAGTTTATPAPIALPSGALIVVADIE
jgi:hypothetical protein